LDATFFFLKYPYYLTDFLVNDNSKCGKFITSTLWQEDKGRSLTRT